MTKGAAVTAPLFFVRQQRVAQEPALSAVEGPSAVRLSFLRHAQENQN